MRLSESRHHLSPAALRDAIRTDLDQALLPRRLGKDFKALIMLSRAPVFFFGALPIYPRLDELLQSALDSLSAIPILMSYAEAGKDKPNGPWSFPALISRFAAILVQHRKKFTCLLPGHFCQNILDFFHVVYLAGGHASSSTVVLFSSLIHNSSLVPCVMTL